MRFSVIAVFISLKLLWGRVANPLMRPKNALKFFPVPLKKVYKESLANYFFKN